MAGEVERRDRTAALRESFGTDTSFYAKFVEIWRHPRKIGDGPLAEAVPETPVSLNDIAWETGTSQGGVAIKMKYMVKQGLAERTSPRTEQAAWKPTEKALELFPDADARPDAGELVTPSGATVRPDTEEDARSWGEGSEYIEVGELNRRLAGRRHDSRDLPRDAPFKGYLPPGDAPKD